MNKPLTDDFFDLSCLVDVISSLLRQAVSVMGEPNPTPEDRADAFNLTYVAGEKVKAADDLLNAIAASYEEERRTVQIELEAHMTITTSTKKPQRSRCEREAANAR